jgi:hypothetical protein
MKILKDIRFFMVVATLSLTGLLVIHLNCLNDLEKTKEELVKCQTDKGQIPGGDIKMGELLERLDSLSQENFIKSNQLGRYEITLDYLKQTNPKAFSQFDKYYYTETE